MIYIVCLCVAVGVIALDLITKALAVSQNFNVEIIPELLKFKLTYNTGASFSFLADKSWAIYMFIAVTVIVCLAILAYFGYVILKKKTPSKWLLIALSMTFSGALGNMIDRLVYGKVRDFIFVFYNTDIFPAIFNVADIFLVVSVIMICIYLFFIDKDAVFKVKKKEAKTDENTDGNGR